MKFVLIIILTGVISNLKSQTCFDAYDLLFTKENKKLSYNEFHKLELQFLQNLKGCEAIDFTASTIKGKELTLSELRGKVVVLNFWFTTCLPCLKEIPELNKLVDQTDGDEVIFIGMARDDKEKLEAFFKKFGIFKYQIVPESYNIANDYKVVGWPQSMVIDREGKVYKTWAGLNENPQKMAYEIHDAINQCLAK